ncbi:MAG TPA: HNH endonuclease signature motif containing protein [Myxococcales bacterium]
MKRQLDDEEKTKILAKHGRKCFATGHDIAPEDALQFDHIRAFATGGPTELDNIAPMCEAHNKAKGALPLGDFRVKLRLQEFFQRGNALTLHDLLEYLKEKGEVPVYGQPVAVSGENGQLTVEFLDGGARIRSMHARLPSGGTSTQRCRSAP